MGITVADLRPSIDITIGAHGYAIGADTTKAGVPRLDTVKPNIFAGEDAIQYLALTAMAKEGVERMRHDGQSSLFVHQLNGFFNAQIWLDALFDEEREHVALFCANLFTDDEIEAIVSFCPQITGP